MRNVGQSNVMRRSIAIGAGLLVASASAFGLWYTRSPGMITPLEQATAAYERGEWSKAAELSRRAARVHRDDPAALRLLARSSARLGNDDVAIGIYARRLGEQTMQAEDDYLLGLAYERRGQADLAARAWTKAVDSGALAPQFLEELARRYMRDHRLDEAMRVTERLSRQPGWEARGLMMLGTVRAAVMDPPGAADPFRRAIAIDPTEVDKSGDPTQFRKLVARTFLRVRQPAEAHAILKPLLVRGPDPEAAWLTSRAFLQEGNKAAAQEALTHAGSYRADNPLEAEPSPYVGESRCEKCHAAIFQDSLASRHTQSYYRGKQLGDLPVPQRPLPDPDDPGVIHTIERQGGTIREQTRVGTQVFDAVVEYAFGTKDRYLTMVNRDEHGGYHIARLSYYDTPEGRGWDRSVLGMTHLSRDQAHEFQGQAIGVRDGLAKCLYCHLTNPRTGREPIGPETADRAIGCERCHGPGGNHVAALEAGFTDPAIVNPAAASPQDVTMKQCNDCHILDQDFRDGDLNDPGWVRSQGVGWTMSRCNTESDGAFGCVTCHDPHKSARTTTTAQYDAKCLTCHRAAPPAAADNAPASAAQRRAGASNRVCSVDASKGCVACHMPPVRINSLHLKLTDHYIRLDRPAR
jgi:predicted CXXCH cytochrome family protein